MASGSNRYTPTQVKILKILGDGMRHSRDELMMCLWDDLANFRTLRTHISNIRKHLRPKGQDIIVEFWERKHWYRQVRLMKNPYKD